jgi:hypothetical protein
MNSLSRYVLLFALACWGSTSLAAETIWLEAEHLDGIRGYCWPMGDDSRKMRETNGNWGLSGPGWAAEWNQGGESGFLSIATGAADDKAIVTKQIEIPADGKYFVWVRYGDWREKTERFQLQLEQGGAVAFNGRFGEKAVIEEDNEMKLYWGWAFAWDHGESTLKKGPLKVNLLSTTKDPEPRQVDVIVLTTDETYRPLIKEQPANPAWKILASYRGGVPQEVEPLSRRAAPKLSEKAAAPIAAAPLPDAWKLRTFRDKGFLYLWNVSHTNAAETWLSDKPDRIKFPYNINDEATRTEFEKTYAGRDDVPIFSDPRVVPTFHGVGPGIFATDEKTGEVKTQGQLFAKWLDANPNRPWAMMMNYHGGEKIGDQGVAMFQKYRDRYVGSISGESLGYFYPAEAEMQAATASAKTRRQLVEAFSPITLKYNTEKYRAVYGKDLDKNAYEDVIACLSIGNIVFVPICYDWGARIAGYESSTCTSSVLNMRWAFMRGQARQHTGLTATYRSCNFGDSSTIFSSGSSFTSPQNLLDNYYSVFSGAGMTWYKFDIWYQYMAGSSMFYHEQGFDEFWKPGGTTAAGIKPVQLSPKGKLVDRFLRTTAANPDRGNPYTPVAFLVDYAHGWEPAPFWPNAFKNWHAHQDRFLFGDHERMLQEWFWTAYYPIGPESEKPITGVNEVYLPAVYGDIFDVICAYPDVNKWRTIDTYPVVIANGEIELTDAEGQRLAQYIERGGTLLVADAHLTGPGVAALKLPAGEYRETEGYDWNLATGEPRVDGMHASGRFRYRQIPLEDKTWQPLARAANGDAFCAAADRGAGRIVYLSVPHGLTIGKQVHPVVPRLIAHLTRGLMPVEVDGDVQWLVSRAEGSWLVTLLNPAGQDKPQQGITATDYRKNRRVVIRSQVPITSARDRLLTDDALAVQQNIVELTVPAGAVRIVELK